MKEIVIALLVCCLPAQFIGQKLDADKEYMVSCVGFYNVENLFDTLNTRGDKDLEFSPKGDKRWNSNLYGKKIANLGQVINGIGQEVSPDGLAILGLAEVENKAVLDDLVQCDELKKKNYKVVHYEGHDRRGIDVALIYQEKYFKYISSKSIELVFKDTSYHSRDQLLVTGELLGEKVHVIVAHWPSRSGGQKRSEPRRLEAAELGRQIIDSLLADEPKAKVIYMGDLNDDPENKSVAKVLRSASKTKKAGEQFFFNPMLELSKKGIGSLAWRDSWNLFDQIILSPGLVESEFKEWTVYRTKVYNKPFLKSKEGKYKGYPYRSFSGDAWTGGYSDHFPVYSILAREKE